MSSIPAVQARFNSERRIAERSDIPLRNIFRTFEEYFPFPSLFPPGFSGTSPPRIFLETRDSKIPIGIKGLGYSLDNRSFLPPLSKAGDLTFLIISVPSIRDARDGSGGVARDTRACDCPSIANGAQAAHVTGTPNVYRMDRTVFQVLQERSPACRDCRCGEARGRASADATLPRVPTVARVWRRKVPGERP